ncbi:hypothetical protein PIB30_069389 [Stylosanthes scabra]|uniref:Uncharacterized protein n=1 Tax=Stylosanthes scabra TaxID=79078 RepID=A0ABU6ZLZ5_9FABA|nr:hypothetical protein [Stylosanthes scabra]
MGEKRPWMETKGREHRRMGLRQLFDKLPVVLGDSVDNQGGDTYALGGCYDLRSSHPHLNPCDHNRLGGVFRNYGGDDSSNLMATATAMKIKDEEEAIDIWIGVNLTTRPLDRVANSSREKPSKLGLVMIIGAHPIVQPEIEHSLILAANLFCFLFSKSNHCNRKLFSAKRKPLFSIPRENDPS